MFKRSLLLVVLMIAVIMVPAAYSGVITSKIAALNEIDQNFDFINTQFADENRPVVINKTAKLFAETKWSSAAKPEALKAAASLKKVLLNYGKKHDLAYTEAADFGLRIASQHFYNLYKIETGKTHKNQSLTWNSVRLAFLSIDAMLDTYFAKVGTAPDSKKMNFIRVNVKIAESLVNAISLSQDLKPMAKQFSTAASRFTFALAQKEEEKEVRSRLENFKAAWKRLEKLFNSSN
ncbi:MAG: hypothetical protein AB1403_09710 [Candidatus Riflebacteria bacterium]